MKNIILILLSRDFQTYYISRLFASLLDDVEMKSLFVPPSASIRPRKKLDKDSIGCVERWANLTEVDFLWPSHRRYCSMKLYNRVFFLT